MKKICLFILALTTATLLFAQKDTLQELNSKLDSISKNVNRIESKVADVDSTLKPLKDTINKIVNDQLIVDQSMLDSAKKFPKETLYKTYFFGKNHKSTTGEWLLFLVSLVVLILMWVAAIYYAKNDSLLKDVCFDKDGKQMKSQFAPFSYSRSQLLWWTLIVLSCYIFFFGATSILIPFNVTSVLLLGFGALVYSSGKLIDNAQIDKGRGDRNQDLGAQNREEPKFFKDILSDDNGISIHRFQAVVFNIVFGIGYIAFFIKSLYHERYPLIEFTDWQFALIGISSATYLGLKASENKDADKRSNASMKALNNESFPGNDNLSASIEYHDESNISSKPPKDRPPNIK
jgi:hypothetical protein